MKSTYTHPLRLLRLLVVPVSAATLAAQPHADPVTLTLTRDGNATAVIVLDENPTRAAQLAAFELQHHVHVMTGATLPILGDDAAIGDRLPIRVGESAATRALGYTNDGFAHQEYLIEFRPESLILMGRDANDRGTVRYDYAEHPQAVNSWPNHYAEQGTMYAVYDFLELHCGVRWINPSDVGTLFTPTPTLRVTGTQRRRTPFMLFRGGTDAADTPAERYQYGGGLWRRGTEGAQAYIDAAYASLRERHPQENVFNLAQRGRNQLFRHRMKAGGDQRTCNHSLYNYYERFWHKEHPNFEEFRPEYFAQGYGDGEPPQLCYSHPATIAQVVADARDYFDHGGYRKPMRGIGRPGYQWGRDFFAIEPMDNSAYCRCDTCAPQYEPERESQSEQSTYWFRFVNTVARELKQTHPDKFISTLAYMRREGLPTDLRIEDNVVVHFCISHNRNIGTAPRGLDAQLARLREWRDQEPNVPMYLWLYHTFPKEIADNGRFYCFPGFFAQALHQQFRLFHELKIQGIFQCGFHGEVENYLSYKWMDNPTLDIEDLLDDYFKAYGPASKALRDWYDLAESRYSDPSLIPPTPSGEAFNGHQNVRIAWDVMGNAESMERLGDLLQQAHAAVEGREPYAQRVALWDLGVWQYMKTGRAQFVERMEAPIPSITAPRVALSGGDPAQVNWEQAAEVGNQWYLRGGGESSRRTFRGRVAHDGEFFYLELVEENVTADQLNVSTQVFPFDVWEPVFARQRAQPFRQYAVGPTGMTRALSHGEVNWRQNVPMQETGIRAVSDTTGNRWVSRLSWPLETFLDEPLQPGDTIYMNILRVSNPTLAGEDRYGIDTWVSYCTVREVDRLGEVKLAP